MVEILSQEEIEALLSSLASEGEAGEADTVSATPATAPVRAPVTHQAAALRDDRRAVAYEVYDFRRPDKFSKEQLRSLQMIHETFSRLFASSLSAYLRVPTHVDLVSVEQASYEDYHQSLTASILSVFTMPPLAGQAILEMEFSIVFSMIDRLLGGPGNMVKSNMVLTEIEQALTESILHRALNDLKSAWEGIVQFTPRREAIETQAQFVQIVPPNDVVVSILFEIKIGELRGAMSLCIPYLLLKPISTKLSGQRWFTTNVKKSDGQSARLLAERLASTYVTCVCRLGTARITVRDLLHLRVGDTLMLDRKATDEIELMIYNKVKFRGKPGIAGRKVAIHINRAIAEDRLSA